MNSLVHHAVSDKRNVSAPLFLFIWRFAGAPMTTLALVSIYWFGMGIWEFIRNPARHWYEITLMVPLLSLTSFVVASIAQIFAYGCIIICVVLFVRQAGYVALWALILLSPLLGLLTWYGYDHFVPDYRFYTDQSTSYQHGLTLERFLNAWGFELLVVLGCWWPLRRRQSLTEIVS